MSKRAWLSGGILAPVTYLVVVVLGGLIRPGYSHYSEAISELVASGAPNKALLDPLFVLYNLAGLAFAYGVLRCVRSRPEEKRRFGLIATGFLFLGGLVGLATVFVPQDPAGPAVTATGAVHIVLAGSSSILSMLSMLFFGLWLRATQETAMARHSFASLIVVFVSGGLAAASVATGFGASGLLERITIFSYLQWMFVVALWLFRLPEHRVRRRAGV
ncbi:MAG: DUF998 domain-containing protein [Candidatus Bipolaricaulis sp.]|nr:DUF998 domain-containing protein [Candidatus Bipolaricaulis sp.]